MDISQKDFDKLVFAVTEKVLLRIPEVLGNLMQNHAEINKLNKEFYAENPDFSNHLDCVRSVIQMIEREDIGLSHKEVLNRAKPLIYERIKTIKNTDTKTVVRSKKDLNLSVNSNGEF